jgi:hypothetical protein
MPLRLDASGAERLCARGAIWHSLVRQASSLGVGRCACGHWRLRCKSGRAPKRLRSGSSRACCDARQARMGFACALRGAGDYVTFACSAWAARAQSRSLGDF